MMRQYNFCGRLASVRALSTFRRKAKGGRAGMKDENVGKFPFFKCDVITSLN